MKFITDFILYFFKIFIIFTIIALIIFIIELIATYKLYKKAGYKGWESIIPFYNNWILIKIAELNEWYYLGLLSPTICTILNIERLEIISSLIYLTTTIFIYYNISKKFNKDLFFTILMIIFPFIMINCRITRWRSLHILNDNGSLFLHKSIGR